MHPVFYFLLTGAATALFVYVFCIALFIDARRTDTLNTQDSIVTLRAICFVSFVTSTLPFLAWELEYGSAFSYFWPLHGLKRIDDYTWRIGLFLKTIFLASSIALLVAFLAGPSLGEFAEHFNATELPVLSRLSYVDALMVPVCAACPIIATLIYTAVPNLGNKTK